MILQAFSINHYINPSQPLRFSKNLSSCSKQAHSLEFERSVVDVFLKIDIEFVH